MGQNPFSESDSFLSSVEIIRILWSRKIHYQVRLSLQFVLAMRQINSVTTLTTDFSFNLMLSSNISPGLTSALFWSGFPTKSLYTSLFFPILAICSILLF
jgi:hypothetical protein